MIIDINLVIGSSLNRVNELIGVLESQEFIYPSGLLEGQKAIKAIYHKGKFEVVFIDNIADWITININNYPFDKNILSKVGINIQEPDIDLPNVLRWNSIYPYEEISVFSDMNRNIDYIYVKALTK